MERMEFKIPAEVADWLKCIGCAVTICDKDGVILYMNDRARKTYEKHGDLIGNNLYACHNERSQQMIRHMLITGETNTYTVTKGGVNKLIFQTPWRRDGEIAGIAELSIPLPDDIKHYDRDKDHTSQKPVTCGITSDHITDLKQDEIFVFGSNLQGMHCGGAARTAVRRFGAVMGQGTGLQGQSYAIPTMQGGVETIKPYVDRFLEFAESHPEMKFLVTRIGCGIAGFEDKDIAPLFAKAISKTNISLPKEFIEELISKP